MKKTQKRVLIAVDGSEPSVEAVRYASRMLSPEKVRVTLLHVKSHVTEFLSDMGLRTEQDQGRLTEKGWEDAFRASINQFMTEARQTLLKGGIPREAVTTVIREREKGIARDILTESKKRYGAVLFARRGFNPLNDHVLGSVANKLIEKLTHTTLCLVGIGRKPRNEKLLVALDTSERAMKALEVVYRYMNPSAVTVTLFHAVRDVGLFQKGYADLFNLRAVSGKREGDEADILSLFRVYKDRLIEGGLDSTSVDTKVVTGVKSRAGAIIQEARDGDYDTVVMGRKGQSNVAEFPMGRVTRKVIQMATDKAVWVAS